jgi:hypothetical protein
MTVPGPVGDMRDQRRRGVHGGRRLQLRGAVEKRGDATRLHGKRGSTGEGEENREAEVAMHWKSGEMNRKTLHHGVFGNEIKTEQFFTGFRPEVAASGSI